MNDTFVRLKVISKGAETQFWLITRCDASLDRASNVQLDVLQVAYCVQWETDMQYHNCSLFWLICPVGCVCYQSVVN